MVEFYEQGRLSPFREATRGYHSNKDLIEAYLAWSNAVPGTRLLQWEIYCDIRDGYSIGTNAALRERLKKQQNGYNEARYVNATLAGK